MCVVRRRGRCLLLLLKVRGSTSSGCCPNQSSQLRDTTPVMNRQKNEAWNAGNFKGTLFSFPLDWKNNFVLELTTTVEGIHLPVNGGNSTKLGRHFEQVHLHFVAHWETKKIFFFFFSFFFLFFSLLNWSQTPASRCWNAHYGTFPLEEKEEKKMGRKISW